MEAFSRRLAKGRTWLPDVLYFSDDYTASGALKSLMSAGVRIPDDVRVITWSNRGNGPVFPFPVDYVQLDPREDGRKVATEALRTMLEDGRTNECCLCCKYIKLLQDQISHKERNA